MRTLAIVPTLNEADNIKTLIDRVRGLESPPDLLIVDDCSDDGTAALVQSALESDGGIGLICREGARSFSGSYLEGFRHALDKGYDAVVCLDADLSHNPNDIPRLMEALEDADLVIGSRYMRGTVNVVNWPVPRLFLSLFSSLYVRMITGLPVSDPMAGFKAIRCSALRRLAFERIRSQGFGFQVDVVYRLFKSGMRVTEVPVVFTQRGAGKSKMSFSRIVEAMLLPIQLRLTVREGKWKLAER